MKFNGIFSALLLGTLFFTSSVFAQDQEVMKLTGAAYEEDAISRYQAYDVFRADDGEPQVGIVFAPSQPLRNFRVLALTFKDANDSGIFFDEKEIYRAEELSVSRPLLVRLTFMGDIPNYGISYEGSDGKVHKFTVGESGMDGSLVLSPFN
jgi:hypothetical protein